VFLKEEHLFNSVYPTLLATTILMFLYNGLTCHGVYINFLEY